MLATLGLRITLVGWPAGTAVAGAELFTALVNLEGRRPTPDERADWAALAARSEFLPLVFLELRPALGRPLLELLPPPEERADLEAVFLMLNSL